MTTATIAETTAYFTTEQVAELCHVSDQTIARWLRLGKLPRPTRLGRRLLFPADEIKRHLAQRRAEPA
jgi:excisionase family DNA binding protein